MRTYVLVPGAGGSPWAWHRVAALLADAGHDVRSVDLPGADPDATLADHVELVVAAAQDADDLVLVAHSFGGFSASAAAARLAARELVLVNAMIPSPGESGAGWWRAVGQREARREAERAAGRDPAVPFSLEAVFLHDLPEELREQAPLHERDQAERAFTDPWPLAAWPSVPSRVVASDDDRLFPLALQQRVARERLGLDVVVVPGGHLNALSRPVELVDAITTSAPAGSTTGAP